MVQRGTAHCDDIASELHFRGWVDGKQHTRWKHWLRFSASARARSRRRSYSRSASSSSLLLRATTYSCRQWASFSGSGRAIEDNGSRRNRRPVGTGGRTSTAEAVHRNGHCVKNGSVLFASGSVPKTAELCFPSFPVNRRHARVASAADGGLGWMSWRVGDGFAKRLGMEIHWDSRRVRGRM